MVLYRAGRLGSKPPRPPLTAYEAHMAGLTDAEEEKQRVKDFAHGTLAEEVVGWVGGGRCQGKWRRCSVRREEVG